MDYIGLTSAFVEDYFLPSSLSEIKLIFKVLSSELS